MIDKFFNKKAAGFTLLELLIVIGIIAVLATAVIVALNPARQFAQANNGKRRADVNAILNSIGQYMADNKGVLPASIDALAVDTYGEVCKTSGTCTGLVDLTVLVPTYIVSMPTDPTTSSTNGTGYEVAKTAADRVKVRAPGAQLSETIEISR